MADFVDNKTVFAEKLIEEVRKRDFLYNMKLKKYKTEMQRMQPGVKLLWPVINQLMKY
jgi:hypothetical protein